MWQYRFRLLPSRVRRLALLLVLVLTGCAGPGSVYVSDALQERAETHADTTALSFRVILVGDAGAPVTDEPDPLLTTLRHHADDAGERSAVVFLGDNLYDDGLPPEDDPDRADAEARLQAQIDAVADAPGRTVFLPGNHDWNHSQAGGREQLRRQEAFVEAALGPGAFLPSDGFPGPVAVDLTDSLRLLVIDTEWWLGLHARGEGVDEEAGTSVGTDDDFLLALSEAVETAGNRRLLVVGHHPIVSEGDHSGAVPPLRHLFPLLAVDPKAYVPLPFLGSLYIGIKRFEGEDRQDLGHPRYRELRAALTDIFAPSEGLVYAAGHDHSLQYHEAIGSRRAIRHIISGSGSEGDFVVPREAMFAASVRGFVVLDYMEDGSAVMTAIRPARGRPEGEVMTRAPILPPFHNAETPVDLGLPPPALPDSARAAASLRYAAAPALLQSLIGDGYRETWATPVSAPVLDIGTMQGGLVPYRTGGDRQSRSLWLRDARGLVYKLRSIEKHPANPFGLGLTSGKPHEWAQDVTSGAYPYAAPVAARLSDSAGLYHTNPRLVYIPDDPRLGPYREPFADQLMMLEDQPDGPAAGRPNFGEAEDLMSASKLRRELDADADHRVDSRFYLRARLFDMLIGDWDRHPEQWRWAAFEPGDLDPALTGDAASKGKVYRPVARDRDFALNSRDGLLFDLTRPHLPKLQGLQERYGNVEGLTRSGREQDRRFLAPLSREDYRREVASLQAALTDEALSAALDAIPPEVRGRDRQRLLDRLRARRDALESAAMTYFELLNGTLDVVGSHDEEVLKLEWLDGDRLRMRMSQNRNRDDDFLLWERTVIPSDETQEVHVWLRGGDDRIIVTGQRGENTPRLRILSGAGTDVLDDRTDGAGLSVYDGRAPEALRVEASGERADIDRTNRIPTSAFGYAPARAPEMSRSPLIVLGTNGDDGFVIGAGLEIENPGFGRDRFLRRHRITASVATATGGVRARYAGVYPDAMGPTDLGLRAIAHSPLVVRNFFGFGDGQASGGLPTDSFRVRLARVEVEPLIERDLPRAVRAWIGPTARYARPDVDSTRYFTRIGLPARDLGDQLLAGIVAGLEVDAVDDTSRPSQGGRFELHGRVLTGLLDRDHTYAGIGTSLTLYATHPALPWATLAMRGGGETLTGTFPFYDAATIGGRRSLRGYRAERFTGRSSVFASVEPRVRLSRFRIPITGRAEVGLLAFADAGRVWADGEATSWQVGTGGGVWLSLPGLTNVTATVENSDEYNQLALRLGFAL